MALAMISIWNRSSRWHVCKRQIALRRPPDLLSLPVEQFRWEAFHTDDFDGALATLTANGFREDAAEDDPIACHGLPQSRYRACERTSGARSLESLRLYGGAAMACSVMTAATPRLATAFRRPRLNPRRYKAFK
jgi:hypothetical protein